MKEIEYVSLKDIGFFFKQIFRYGLSKWKLILAFGLAGGLAGFFYAAVQAPVYEAKLSFLVNENEQAPTLNLSSLAGLAGISGMAGGSSVNEEKLLFIANSRLLVGTSLMEEAEVGGVKKMMVNHYIDIFQMESSFKADTALNGFSYFIHQKLENLSYAENKVLDKILREIVVGKQFSIEARKKQGIISQGSGIIILDYKSANEAFAKTFIEILYANLGKYYTNKIIQRQLKNYNLIKVRTDSIREVLFNKENYGAAILDKNIGLIKMQGRVEIERTRRDVEMLSLMYGEVLKNLEVARFTLDNQTPIFQTIDAPTLPLEKEKMSRLNTAIISAILLSFIGFLWLLSRNFRVVMRGPEQQG